MTLILKDGNFFNVKNYIIECSKCKNTYKVNPEKESKFEDEVHCTCGHTLIHSQEELKKYGEFEIS